jgi:hypothetical protein
MRDTFTRELKMRRCIYAMNPGGWMAVSDTVRILRRMRSRMKCVDDVSTVAFSMFPKHQLWFMHMECSYPVLMDLIQAVTEFLFDVDLIKSPCDVLVFLDAEGTSYLISDLWLVITDPDNLCMRLRLDEIV